MSGNFRAITQFSLSNTIGYVYSLCRLSVCRHCGCTQIYNEYSYTPIIYYLFIFNVFCFVNENEMFMFNCLCFNCSCVILLANRILFVSLQGFSMLYSFLYNVQLLYSILPFYTFTKV